VVETLARQLDAALKSGDMHAAKLAAHALLVSLPQDANLWRTLAVISVQLQDIPAALQAIQRALALQATAEHHADYAAILEAAGENAAAETALRHAMALQPLELSHQIKLAAVLLTQGNTEAAAALAAKACSVAGAPAVAWQVWADCAFAAQDFSAAMKAYQRALQLKLVDARIWYNLGLCANKLGHISEAVQAFDQALQVDPKLYAALSQKVFCMRAGGMWDALAADSERLIALVRLRAPGITPFGFLSVSDDPALQLQCAKIQAHEVATSAALMVSAPSSSWPVKRKAPLRAGFVSNGFGQHPTGLLCVQMFECFDHAQITPILFCTSADDRGPIRARLAKAAEIVACTGMTAPKLAAKIASMQIDILLDMRGYGDGALPEVFALRPARINVNFLAYPGTLGSACHDYIIADEIVLPPQIASHFSETVQRLPLCFQPFDATAHIAPSKTRAHYGLAEDSFVFASFNNSYKIGPEVFRVWLQLLRAVPESQLWLLNTPATASFMSEICAHATKAGVANGRIVFLEKCEHSEYLAAYQHADLFLDTWPYGAHTTARDAIYAGCPVLTLTGQSFAARVATSLNCHQDLPELCCDDVESYAAKALRYSTDAPWRARIRQKMQQHRAVLFDSKAHAQAFTVALHEIWLA
jgi:predicted O-linked N-acetylglucosamine transferase (SPINDLY family)